MPSADHPRDRDTSELANDVATRFDGIAKRLERLLNVLRCEECGVVSIDAAVGWRAYLTVDDEVAVYCPDCAAVEFGGDDA